MGTKQRLWDLVNELGRYEEAKKRAVSHCSPTMDVIDIIVYESAVKQINFKIKSIRDRIDMERKVHDL